MKVSTLVWMMVNAGTARRMLQLFTLLVVSAATVSIAPVQRAWAAGCTDPDETPFESLTITKTTVTVPAQLNRSLCGFYDGDYIAFTGETGKTYHIEILNFEAPNDLQLAVYSDNGTGNYTFVTSVAGKTELDLPVNVSGKYIVNVTSSRSLLGFYGGGDYVFKLTAVGEAPPELTPDLSTVSLNPISVQGGSTVQGTVTLTSAAPACGTPLALVSSNPNVAQVPAIIMVPAGATSATFTVSTSAVETTTTTSITATSAGGTTQSSTFTVNQP